MLSNIGRGYLVTTYIDTMYEMLVAYDFLLAESFGQLPEDSDG